MEIQPLTAQIDVVIDKQPLIDKINQLQQTIETLTQEKAQLEQDLASANAQIDLLNVQIQALNTQIETLQGEKLQLQEQIAQLQSEVSTLESQKASLENQVSTLTSQISSLESQISNLQSQISDLQSQISTLQGDLDSINGEVVQDKTGYLAETKTQIKNAIIDKGVSVDSSDTFRSYATKINQIPQTRNITDKNTLLLCPFDESPTKDIGPFGYVLQTVGNPVISSNQMLFNKPTLYLDGSSALILNDSNFQIFMGNFTFEFWWFPIDYSRTQTYSFLGQDANSQYASPSNYKEYWQHYCIRNDRAEISFCYDNLSNGRTANTLAFAPYAWGLKLNEWNHLAFVKNAEFSLRQDSFRFYLNGIKVGWYTNPYGSDYYYQLYNPQTVLSPLTIFFFQWVNGNRGQYVKGYISNLRLSNCARYTTDSFTPPTEPFSI